MNCYLVTVKTTDSLKDTFCSNEDKYFDCEDGNVYVVCKNPKEIYRKFGDEVVLKIEKIGIGYCL